MEQIDKKIEDIDKKIEDIDAKLDIILEILNSNKSSCKKMGDHIDFIENVYENVKNPLGFICNKVSYLTRGEKSALPSIKMVEEDSIDKEKEDFMW